MDDNTAGENLVGAKSARRPAHALDPLDTTGPTIIRTHKNRANPYVLIHRRVLEDRHLSWAARGVMVYLLAKPDNWSVQPKDLQFNGGCGRDAIRRIMRELELYGYLWRQRVKQKDGTFGWVHRVYESPDLNPNFRPETIETAEKLSPEKASMVEPSLVEPSPGKPSPGKPSPVKTSSYQDNHVLNNHGLNKQRQEKHTQTTAAPASPLPGVECVLSKYSLEECRRYADHLHKTGQGIKNPRGFAKSILRSGECDEQIAAFLGAREEPAAVEQVDVVMMLSEGRKGRNKLLALVSKLYDRQDPRSDVAARLALLRGDIFSASATELSERYKQIKALIQAEPLAKAVNGEPR